MKTVNSEAKAAVGQLRDELELKLDRDVVAFLGPISGAADVTMREALEIAKPRRAHLAVIIYTGGGVAEITERIAESIRHHYEHVTFIVPDVAMSAGTILVLSGDEIWMDYFSRLGPIDPQVPREGGLVPALSYLSQFERLIGKANRGELNKAEYGLLLKFDLAELHKFEEARELSVSLVTSWLSRYKFKTWTETETKRTPVTEKMRWERAESIARKLANHELWHSHGRGISASLLHQELGLRIDDFGKHAACQLIRDYHSLLLDFVAKIPMAQFVHAKDFF